MLEEATITVASISGGEFHRGDYCSFMDLETSKPVSVRVTKVDGTKLTVRRSYRGKLGEWFLKRLEDWVYFPAADVRAFVARKFGRV